MKENSLPNVASHESMRQEIERQVQAYLAEGGEIEQLQQKKVESKGAGPAWRPTYAGSFE